MTSDTFSETAYLAICKKAGTPAEYKTIIETIDTSGGEKGFDSIASIGGGRLKKFNPQEDFEVTLEGYAVEVGTDTGAVGKGFYDLMYNSADSTQPISISADRTRNEYQVVILMTENTTSTIATGVVPMGKSAKRVIMNNGHFTNVQASFTDKVWKYTVTYKVPPFNKAGTSNITYESTDGTASMSAVAAYS